MPPLPPRLGLPKASRAASLSYRAIGLHSLSQLVLNTNRPSPPPTGSPLVSCPRNPRLCRARRGPQRPPRTPLRLRICSATIDASLRCHPYWRQGRRRPHRHRRKRGPCRRDVPPHRPALRGEAVAPKLAADVRYPAVVPLVVGPITATVTTTTTVSGSGDVIGTFTRPFWIGLNGDAWSAAAAAATAFAAAATWECGLVGEDYSAMLEEYNGLSIDAAGAGGVKNSKKFLAGAVARLLLLGHESIRCARRTREEDFASVVRDMR